MVKNNQTSIVNLELSPKTLKGMKDLSANLATIRGQVKEIQKAFQDLGTLQKRNQVNSALNTPGFQQGQALKAQNSAENTSSIQRLIDLGNTRLNQKRLEKNAEEALQLSLQKQLRSTNQLVSVSQAKALLDRASLRASLESAKGPGIQLNLANKLVQVTRERLEALKREEAQLKRNAQAAAQLTDKQKGIRARSAARERLFGDGGANLFSIQAGLIANFAVIGGLQSGLRNAVTFTVQLDEALRNLQAIVRITDTNLAALKSSLIGISEETKFTAVEVAQAAVTLGQAGFSVDEIQSSLRAVTLLATATGTDLPRAVDIATSVLGVFGLQSSEMGRVADVMTSAVNNSKLNIEKLALGLQFSGNIAAQSGLRFEELTAALGAMANAGIRSGSTLGTGMRQILISLQKPSREFKDTLSRLGLTMADVDIKSNGLAGVLLNLSKAGFTAEDAIRAFEVRGASAFNALVNNVDKMLSLEASFINTTAAVAANETQMRSLANQGRRLASVLGTVAAVGLEPIKSALIPLTSGISEILSGFKEWEKSIQFVTISLTIFTTVVAGLLLGRLVKNLALIALGGQTVAGAMGVASAQTAGFTLTSRIFTASTLASVTAMKASVVASLSFAGALRVLSAAAMFMVATPIGLMLTAIAAVTSAVLFFGKSTSKAASEVEKSKTAFDNTAGAAEEMAKKISSVDGEIEELINRQNSLRENAPLLNAAIGRVQNQFTNMGRDATSVGTTVEELISSLQDLRQELATEFKIKLDEEGLALDGVLSAKENLLTKTITRNQAEGRDLSGNDRFRSDSQLFVDNPNGLKVSRELTQAQERRLKLKSEDTAASRAQVKVEDDLIKRLQELLRLLIDIEKLEARRTDILDNQNFAADQSSGVIGRALASSTVNSGQARLSAAAGLSAEGSTARERLEDLKARELAFETQQALAFSAAEAAGPGSPQTLEQIRDDTARGLGEFSRAREQAEAEFESVQKAIESLDISALQQVVKDTTEDVAQAQTIGQTNRSLATQLKAIEALGKREIEQIKAKGLDSEQEAREIEAREAQLGRDSQNAIVTASSKITKLTKDSTESLAKVDEFVRSKRLGLLRSEKDRLLSALEEAEGVDETTALQEDLLLVQGEIATELRDRDAAIRDLSQAERQALNSERESSLLDEAREIREIVSQRAKEITDKATGEQNFAATTIKQLNDQVRLQRLILLFGEDSVEVAIAREKIERENFVAMVKTKAEAEDLQRKMIAVFDAGRRFQGLDLGLPLRKALAGADAFLKKLATVESRTADLQFEGQILDIERGTIDNPVERARLTEKARLERQAGPNASSAERREIERAATAAAENERKRQEISEREKRNSGGGGGGKEETDAEKRAEEMRRLLARFENISKSAELGIDSGSLSLSKGVGIQQGALGETRGALAEREALISKISANVSRTAVEEERLTTLLEEHEALTSSIEEQEKRITQEKGRQGQFQIDLTGLVQDWRDANLDVNASFENGLGNTLSSMKSGFAELFTSLSRGSVSAGQAFKNFAITVAEAMQAAVAEMIAVRIMQQIIGMIPGTSGDGSFGGFLRAFLPKKNGGLIRKAGGGEVPGNLNRDSVPALLMPGEFVLRRSATQAMGVDNLREINAMGNRRFASGGHVGAGKGLGQSKPQNLWLVDERSRAPVPGPSDIVAIISDDMSRGGQTKHLIRSISNGEI